MSTTKIEIFKDVTCVTHLFIDGVRVKWWTVTPSQLDIDIAIKNEQLKAESFLSFVGLTDPADYIEYEDRQEVLRSMGRMPDEPQEGWDADPFTNDSNLGPEDVL